VNLSEIGKGLSKEEIRKSFENLLEETDQTLNNYTKTSTLVITNEWTIENEMLTPTLKVKRTKIDDLYGNKYLEWHAHKSKVIWIENNRQVYKKLANYDKV